MRRAEARIATSFLPPASQTVTHSLQPTIRIFWWSLTISMISSMGFLSATIIKGNLLVRCRGPPRSPPVANRWPVQAACGFFLANLMGLGPSWRILSVISLAYWANRGPSLEDRLYIRARSPPDPHGLEDFLGLFHPFSGPKVSPNEMAFAFFAPDHVDPVRALFKSTQNMVQIDLARAGHPHDLDVGRIIQPHGTCQVRGGVPSVVAGKCDDDGLERVAHSTPFSKASTLHVIWSSSYQLSSMALAGHSAAQTPHPWQVAGSISLTPSSLIRGTP